MLLALLIAASADLHGSVGLGVGNGYDLLGARAEVGYGGFSALVGFGYTTIRKDWDHSLSVGARWSFLQPESGPAVAVHACVLWWDQVDPTAARQTVVILSATLSWRWRLGPLFFELGAGPAATHASFRYPTRDYDADNGRLVQRWRWGVVPGPEDIFTHNTIPIDVDIGMGFAF
jgi:hypothetical protein